MRLEASFVHPPQPSGYRSIEERLAEAETNPKRSRALANARGRLAKTLYPDGSLAALRMREGLSQKELAQRIGTSQSRLSRIEAGLDDPLLSTARKLADALSVDLNTISDAVAAKREKQS
ncbi:helix-turn-helix domain-containing protein [Thiocapsa marina]|uniref:helix-turn-helix domain-containing protein n=1 Tax=Thiocapsa marina TaxID=244573 RepID=UPI001F2ACFEB|nr:helix-turn-helix transcriptional regulator [Thiocapsa marina]